MDAIEFECADCGFRCGPVDLNVQGFTGIIAFLSFFGMLYAHQGSCGAVGGMVGPASCFRGEIGPNGAVLP